MLGFFHAPVDLELKPNVRFPAMRFRGSERNKVNGIIPFSHIYMTSVSQIHQFARYGNAGDKLLRLDQATADFILAHKRCPANLSFRPEGLREVLRKLPTAEPKAIKLAVFNGMGRGLGDNVAGLGAVQLAHSVITELFDKVEIDLLQRNTQNQSALYSRHDVVSETVQLPVSVSKFFSYDAYVDLSDLISIPQFSELSLYDFFVHALALKNEVRTKKEKKTTLAVSAQNTDDHRAEIFRRSGAKPGKKVVLIHPVASTPLRSIPEDIQSELLLPVFEQCDAIFIHCVKLNLSHPKLIDMSDRSVSINDLIDIVSCCDRVFSVGTVVYHVSGNLGVATALIPTVQADIDSARQLPSVKVLMPWGARSRISTKHMSKESEDVDKARQIFERLKSKELIKFIGKK